MPSSLISKLLLRRALEKLAETLLSVKVYILIAATFLLIYGKIGETVWSTVICTIGLGRVVLEALKGKNEQPKEPTE
jgi:hypothetical protein